MSICSEDSAWKSRALDHPSWSVTYSSTVFPISSICAWRRSFATCIEKGITAPKDGAFDTDS